MSTAYSPSAARSSAQVAQDARVGRSTLTVAVVAPSLEILGGQGVQAKALMDALRADGFPVMFVPINPVFPSWLLWVRAVPFLRTVLNQLLYIPSLHRLRHAHVVHVFSASYWSFLLAPVPAILAARWFRKPVVLNYHSGEAGDHLAHWGLRVHPWLQLADEIVVPSQYLQHVFAQHGYPTRVIRNMIDTTSFCYRERSPLQPRLLSARNLESHYRVDNTLQAFALVQRERPDATLVVAGYGSQEATLKTQAQGMKGVRFVGRVEPQDMPALYDSADIFLNSSDIDNQPVSILEAFSAGLAVVSTPTGDIPAMLLNGARGQLVPHNDPQAMASAVLTALEQPAATASMIRRARNEAETYTGPMVCREWADLYTATASNLTHAA
jgi:glycosyltransferase involved in cell wall biosynthesis